MMMLMTVKTVMTIIHTLLFFGIFDLRKIEVSSFGKIKDLGIGSSASTE